MTHHRHRKGPHYGERRPPDRRRPTYSMTIAPEVVEAVDRAAQAEGSSRSAWVEAACLAALAAPPDPKESCEP